jgi:transcription termination/antitermination protein NusA
MAILDYISEFARENNISKDLAEQILREAMITVYKKKYGKENENAEVVFEKKLAMYQVRDVVEVIENPVTQILAEEGLQYTRKKTLKIGDQVKVPIPIDGFGRQIAQIVKQILKQKIVEIQKDIVYNEFKHKVGEIVIGKIKSRTEGFRYSGYYVALEPKDTEAFLPFSEMIPEELFEKNDFIKAILLRVNEVANKEEAQLIVSRASEDFARELLRTNIPEINDGTFSIKAIARKAGEVTKVVLDSNNDNFDPVSVTIGKQGSRIKPIRAELGSERIEIIRWSEDNKTLIKNAIIASRVLKNRIAEVFNTELNSDKKEAYVVVPNEFVAPLIGKKGSHQRMLEKITGWNIRFVPYSDYEVKIAEKQKEVDQILGISGDEQVEFIEEESIPISMLPFTADQAAVLQNAGFEDVADIIEYSIEDLAKKCEINIDEAMTIWKVIEDNVEIEEEKE